MGYLQTSYKRVKPTHMMLGLEGWHKALKVILNFAEQGRDRGTKAKNAKAIGEKKKAQ